MHNVLRKSQCIGKWLHRFNIVEEYPDGVVENCEVCHKSKFFKLVDGKADNVAYMDWHIRSALPPNHPLFYHEYKYDPYNNDIISPYV